MNAFFELLRKRRSIRQFIDRPVDAETVHKLIDATFTAPSSKNTRSTRLAVITNRELLAKLATMRPSGAGFVKDAPLAFAVMGDEQATDLWIDNCAISATILQLAAESEGLASCWVHVNGRPHTADPADGTAEDYVRALLGTPANWRILCLVAVGYPAVTHKPHEPKAEDAEKVVYLK